MKLTETAYRGLIGKWWLCQAQQSNSSIHPARLLLRFLQLRVSFYWDCESSDSLQRSLFLPFSCQRFCGIFRDSSGGASVKVFFF